MLGLGIPAAAVAQCKQYIVQIPCEAQAGLHKLRTKLEGNTVRGLPQPLNQALDDLQVGLTATSSSSCWPVVTYSCSAWPIGHTWVLKPVKAWLAACLGGNHAAMLD